MKFQGVKGTIDYYPLEREVFNYIANRLREQALKYGFLEIETPAIEYLSLLCEKEGDEIKSQIFTLEKRSKEQLGLRFDITVPAVRMYITKQKELPKPVKWFYITRMWRYEQPQKGRLREFYQFGIELLGSNKLDADAQVIALAIDGLRALGLTEKDFVVKINNRDLLQGILEDLKIKKIEECMVIIDKIAKISEEEFIKELEGIGLGQKQIVELDKIIKEKDINDIKASGKKAKEGLESLKTIMRLLSDKKDFIEVDLSCARGLAYYTGTVFEAFDRESKYRALVGGGRYDKMIENFGGNPEPATGFGMGFATLQLLLEDKKLLPPTDLGVDYYIVIMDGKCKEYANTIANKLRAQYMVDLDLMCRNTKKQIEFAQKIGAKNIIIIGENELKSKKLKAKDVITGKETDLRL